MIEIELIVITMICLGKVFTVHQIKIAFIIYFATIFLGGVAIVKVGYCDLFFL